MVCFILAVAICVLCVVSVTMYVVLVWNLNYFYEAFWLMHLAIRATDLENYNLQWILFKLASFCTEHLWSKNIWFVSSRKGSIHLMLKRTNLKEPNVQHLKVHQLTYNYGKYHGPAGLLGLFENNKRLSLSCWIWSNFEVFVRKWLQVNA